MKIAVVILNWNGQQLLEQFLPSVMAFSKEANVYLADNASSDNSLHYVKHHFPRVKIIKNTVNGGYAKGYNDALKQIDEDVFCLLNSDIKVTKNWLSPVIQEFKSNKSTAIIQPKNVDFKAPNKFEHAGAAGGYIDEYGYAYCRGRLFDTLETNTNQYSDSSIFWASGACFFIRKETFFTLNGFDESFFAHYEEIDLCWRAHNLGLKTKCIANSLVYHVGGATLNKINPKKTYLNFRNSLYCITKNAHGFLPLLIFTRLCLDGLTGLRFLTQFKVQHFFAIIKAHFSFYSHLFGLLKQRSSSIQKQHYYHTKSIVWQYFIRRKKYFSQI